MPKLIDMEEILKDKAPHFFAKYSSFQKKIIMNCLNWIIKVKEINAHITKLGDKRGLEAIEELLDNLDFSYYLSDKDRKKIPSEGKLVCVANHPLGGLDGLALLKAIGEVRPDVKVVVNEFLMYLENFNELYLPLDVFNPHLQKAAIKQITESMLNENVIIFFPAAEVSRASIRGIYDTDWQKGALQFSQKYQAPILPVYIRGRNSTLFYLISFLNKKFSTLLLPREIFRQRKRSIKIKIGDPIPGAVLNSSVLNNKELTRLLKRHVYRIGHNKPGVFKTEKTIIHPSDKSLIKKELEQAELLVNSSEGYKVYLVEQEKAKHTMQEIARLRELTFRKVGEGTGNCLDTDKYDNYYKHLVLWSDRDWEIIGAYRIGITREIITKYGYEALYTSTLVEYSEDFKRKINNSIELGRSFIQYKYWKSRALDYLWKGIGAFLSKNPDLDYMFGLVSISDNYNDSAKILIVSYYKKWYAGDFSLLKPRREYLIPDEKIKEAEIILCGKDENEDYRNLKSALKALGFSVPVLYKRYTDLTDMGGSKFISFGVDDDFAGAIDGMIMVELSMIREAMRKRYYTSDEQ